MCSVPIHTSGHENSLRVLETNVGVNEINFKTNTRYFGVYDGEQNKKKLGKFTEC